MRLFIGILPLIIVLCPGLALAQMAAPTTSSSTASSDANPSTAAEAQSQPNRESSRIEELLIWKVSEDLHLSVADEKRIGDMIHDLDQKKLERGVQVEKAQKDLEAVASDAEARRLLRVYKEALRSYNQISVEEVERVQKILKAPMAAQYFVVKSHLSRRIRNLLGSSAPHGEIVPRERGHVDKVGPLSDPKIIEE